MLEVQRFLKVEKIIIMVSSKWIVVLAIFSETFLTSTICYFRKVTFCSAKSINT